MDITTSSANVEGEEDNQDGKIMKDMRVDSIGYNRDNKGVIYLLFVGVIEEELCCWCSSVDIVQLLGQRVTFSSGIHSGKVRMYYGSVFWVEDERSTQQVVAYLCL